MRVQPFAYLQNCIIIYLKVCRLTRASFVQYRDTVVVRRTVCADLLMANKK